jgi:hypothetical protein
MAINFRSNTVISNLRIGPLSGGEGGGGGGGSSEPSFLAVGAYGVNSNTGTAYVYDATNYSATPTRITPSGLDAGDNFGLAIAASSNHIVVGAYQDDDQHSNAGAVYVYDATNLSASPTKLTPSVANTSVYYGSSVAATLNQIIVGATLDGDQGDGAGAVYVYDATNLSATPTKLAPSGLGNYDIFGKSVAATSNQIIVGTHLDDDRGDNAGAVYVYDANNLSATPTKLAPSGLDSNDYFGESVAVTSNQIVVGARFDDDRGSEAGAVYVYDATNLSATPTKLVPSGLGQYDYFGQSVAATSNHIVVGAVRDDDQGGDAGAVYVYDATNLSATPTKLTPSGIGADDEFGHSVAAYGNQIVVGAKMDDDQATNAGAVYVYDANNLSASPTKLTPSDLGGNFEFGASVSLG